MADERIDPENVHPVVWGDHAHRYLWASQFAFGTVLDVASGAGYGSEFLLRQSQVAKYIGVDLEFSAVRSALDNFNSTDSLLVQGNAIELPFRSESMDTITCFETLEHSAYPEEIIAELARILQPGGLLLGSVPSDTLERATTRVYGPNGFHKSKFTRVRLERLLQRSFSRFMLLEQSLEIASILRRLDDNGVRSLERFDNPRYQKLAPGCWLFAVSKAELPGALNDQEKLASTLVIGSILDHDAPTVEYVRGLQRELSLASQRVAETNQVKAAIERRAAELEGLIEQAKREQFEKVTELQSRITLIESTAQQSDQRNKQLESSYHQLLTQHEDLSKKQEQLISDAQRLATERDHLEAEVLRVAAERDGLTVDNQQLRQELQEIVNTRSHRLIQRIVHSPARSLVLAAGRLVMPGRRSQHSQAPKADAAPVQSSEVVHAKPIATIDKPPQFTDAEQVFIDDLTRRPRPVSLGHPNWWGIRASATQLFDATLFAEDNLDEVSGAHLADVLLESQCPALVIQGFPRSYMHVVKAIRARRPSLPAYIVWHGSFVQARLDYDWDSFSTVMALCRDGWFKKIGLVKKGMAEVLAASGLPTGFIMNRVREIPQQASTPLEGGPHLGVWGLWHDNWLKPPFAMLAASKLIAGSIVHSSVLSDRVRDFCTALGVKIKGTGHPIKQADMPQALASMHVNLYVSLSECAPMLPLESLAAGAPCLLGPNSHYFEDHRFLSQHLVVSHPDDAHKIALAARAAIDNRVALIEAYKDYAPGYNQRALESLEAFLEMPVGCA